MQISNLIMANYMAREQPFDPGEMPVYQMTQPTTAVGLRIVFFTRVPLLMAVK